VNARQWRLVRPYLRILGTAPGMSEKALADRLGVTLAELKPVTGMLVGRGLIERCGPDYLILAAQPAPARGDAG